jgi:hypothetical protein
MIGENGLFGAETGVVAEANRSDTMALAVVTEKAVQDPGECFLFKFFE